MPLDSSPPTPPESYSQSRRSSKMQENPEAWAHGIARDSMQLREYPPRTPPTEWKSYAQRRTTYSTQLDRDCLSELPRQQQLEEEEEEDEAYWASVRTLYEKTPSCSRPRPVSVAHRPGTQDSPSLQPYSLNLPQPSSSPVCREVLPSLLLLLPLNPHPCRFRSWRGGGCWVVESQPFAVSSISVLQADA